jgi:hypothetical protein
LSAKDKSLAKTHTQAKREMMETNIPNKQKPKASRSRYVQKGQNRL